MHSYQDLTKAVGVELVGTFLFILAIGAAASFTLGQGGNTLATALVTGLAFCALFYAWSGYGGVHLNPAVSLAFAATGRLNWGLMVVMWIAQIIGAILAVWFLSWVFGSANAAASTGTLPSSDSWKALVWLVILSFLICMSFLLVTKDAMLASTAAIAIATVIAFTEFLGLPLTGTSVGNTAQSIANSIFTGQWNTFWVFVVGPLIGAILAALVYKLFANDWNCRPLVDEDGEIVRDDCGDPIMECERPKHDDCGKIMGECHTETERYRKHKERHGFVQETPESKARHWAASRGIDADEAQETIREFGRRLAAQ